MSGGQPDVHYEIYTHEAGRWIIHARYTRDQRDKAIEEAKQVEKTLGRGVKVVRENYFVETNEMEEAVIYVSEKLARDTPKPTIRPVRAPPRAVRAPQVRSVPLPRASARPPTPTRTVAPIGKLTAIVLMSLLGAGIVAAFAAALIGRLEPLQLFVGPENVPAAIFAVFVVTFLILAIPLAMRRIHFRSVRMAPPAEPPPAPPAVVVEPVEVETEAALEELSVAASDAGEVGLEGEQGEAGPEEEGGEEMAAQEAAGLDAETEEQAKVLLKFLSDVLAQVTRTQPQIDAYTRFGVNLVLAGATDVLATKGALSETARAGVLRQAIEVLGAKGDSARTFAEKLDQYLVEPRYVGMIQAGREAMERFLAENRTPPLASVFEAWNKPQAAEQQHRIMTVLFTDMVGSTDLTQQLGDKGAQEVVRRHNGIVRSVLSQFGGKEIKHTGDGIMASFPSAANGVEAAVAIQRSIAAHNVQFPEYALHVRIGINAGEPIQEDDDLFGATVQLAARVCAFAAKDQIACTNVVRELAANKGLSFIERGPQPLKGFKDPVPLYEVGWTPPAAAAAAR